ncbi:MAG: type II toxin-antitoxin system VapB family antitoxin [Anaerolineales bacterium]|nr:type II toxin-antitoxin system VapB family antitoxin [Anaerolineales bacterium]
MLINIQLTIDQSLVAEAQLVGQHESEAAAIVTALQEYILRHKQLAILDLFGQIEYEPDYDYKQQRQRN